MQISILNPIIQTNLFIIIFVALIVVTAKKDKEPFDLNYSHTNELKGLAILMVIFSHIGYFLFSDHRFLYPLSVAGGVGVNIFLFLSGFGLTCSEIKSKQSILQFYYKRLKNIFVPMWLVLIATILIDTYLIGRNYAASTVIKSFFGFFPNADIDSAINSPMWYFSLILFYYLLFPLTFLKKKAWISAFVIFGIGFIVSRLYLPVSKDVLKLYQLHYVAFPLGILFASVKEPLLRALLYLSKNVLAKYTALGIFIIIVGYTAIHSGIGEKLWIEQATSIITMISLVVIFLIKGIQSKLLVIFGKYSYAIYLIQWPLMYRYDFINKYTPAYLGTILYLIMFLVVGILISQILIHLEIGIIKLVNCFKKRHKKNYIYN